MAKHLWRTLSPCWRQLWEQSREAQVATPVERLGSAEGKGEKKRSGKKKRVFCQLLIISCLWGSWRLCWRYEESAELTGWGKGCTSVQSSLWGWVLDHEGQLGLGHARSSANLAFPGHLLIASGSRSNSSQLCFLGKCLGKQTCVCQEAQGELRECVASLLPPVLPVLYAPSSSWCQALLLHLWLQ